MRRAVIVAALGALGAPATAAAAPTFTNLELAATPPSAVGTTCPGSAACWNGAAEPAIRATPDGRFYASSENALLHGTLAWRSTDGGRHYTSLPSPNNVSAGGGIDTGDEAGIEPGGGDTDVAVATGRNISGFYNVYVASLTLANIDVSTSRLGGASWTLNPVSAIGPVDDREWAAASGQSRVCISYLSAPVVILPEAGLHVQCSDDAGVTFSQISDAYDTSAIGTGARTSSRPGNLAFDPSNRKYLYAVFAYQSVADATNPNPTGLHHVGIAVSSDGGQTFHDHAVYDDPVLTTDYDNNFPNVAVDKAGNVYVAYSDGYNVYLSSSTNHGLTWSPRRRVSPAGQTALFPWIAAGAAGKVDVVYYKTPYLNTTQTPDNYPVSARWTVGFAQNLAATSAGSTFTRSTASPIVHLGGVCRGGVACTGDSTKNRDLYDDFGVAASPVTGMASIVYSDDQYTNTAASPPQPGCTAAQNNTGACDHTSIATQTSGTGVS